MVAGLNAMLANTTAFALIVLGALSPLACAESGVTPTVLLIGGLSGNDASARIVAEEARKYERRAQRKRPFRLLTIPLANPDGGKLVFPPTGTAYRDNAASHALWRSIAIEAPDLILIAGNEDFGLAEALSHNAVAGVGRIPAQRVAAAPGLLQAAPKEIAPSEAHREIERRLARSPRQAAEELARYYGHTFPDAIYIYAIALIGQVRLGNIAEVQRLVEPYADGAKNSLARPTSLGLAGHLIFAELAARTGDPRYLQLVRRVADLGLTATG